VPGVESLLASIGFDEQAIKRVAFKEFPGVLLCSALHDDLDVSQYVGADECSAQVFVFQCAHSIKANQNSLKSCKPIDLYTKLRERNCMAVERFTPLALQDVEANTCHGAIPGVFNEYPREFAQAIGHNAKIIGPLNTANESKFANRLGKCIEKRHRSARATDRWRSARQAERKRDAFSTLIIPTSAALASP
jgi:hypothetical protein